MALPDTFVTGPARMLTLIKLVNHEAPPLSEVRRREMYETLLNGWDEIRRIRIQARRTALLWQRIERIRVHAIARANRIIRNKAIRKAKKAERQKRRPADS